MSKGLRWRKTESLGLETSLDKTNYNHCMQTFEISPDSRVRTTRDLFLIYYIHLFGLTHRVRFALLYSFDCSLIYVRFHFVFRYKSVATYDGDGLFFYNAARMRQFYICIINQKNE